MDKFAKLNFFAFWKTFWHVGCKSSKMCLFPRLLHATCLYHFCVCALTTQLLAPGSACFLPRICSIESLCPQHTRFESILICISWNRF